MTTPGGVLDRAGTQDAALCSVMRDYPGWRAWLSDEGRWWAVRTGAGAQWERGDNTPMTVDADTEAGLRALLAGYAA